jgi:hypothetical protein
MKTNMSSTHKIFRVVVASLISIFYLNEFITEYMGLLFLSIAGEFIFTGFVKFCPFIGLKE